LVSTLELGTLVLFDFLRTDLQADRKSPMSLRKPVTQAACPPAVLAPALGATKPDLVCSDRHDADDHHRHMGLAGSFVIDDPSPGLAR
jgi:hypothetical protein